jgi:hypothetical protein
LRQLHRSDKTLHVFEIEQIFDYVNNQTYEIGGQSFGFTLRSRFNTSKTMSVQTTVQPTASVMTGIVSEYFEHLDRDYDFGSGFGFRTSVSLNKSGFNLLRLATRTLNTPAALPAIRWCNSCVTAQVPVTSLCGR